MNLPVFVPTDNRDEYESGEARESTKTEVQKPPLAAGKTLS